MKKYFILLMIIGILFTSSGCAVSDWGLQEADGKPRISSTDFLYDLVEQNIEDNICWHIFGHNPNVSTTSEAIWEYSSNINLPISPLQMEAFSSNAQDGPGGIGALTIYIGYLDGNYNQYIETLTLNGITPVPTIASDIYRINFMVVGDTGTNKSPVGNITIRGVGGGSVYSYIASGRNIARSAIFTVPLNYTLYITSFNMSSSEAAKGVTVDLKANSYLGCNTTSTPIILDHFVTYLELISYNTAIHIPLETPIRCISGTDIYCSVISAQAGAAISVNLKGWLKEG